MKRATLGIIISFVIAATLAGVGWAVYHQQSINPQDQSKSQVDNEPKFKIVELGVEITQVKGLEGLGYVVDKSVQDMVIVAFTTKPLLTAANTCTEGSIGTIARYTQKPTPQDVTTAVKHVGDYYYTFTYPQGGCATGVAFDMQTSQAESLRRAFDTLAISV